MRKKENYANKEIKNLVKELSKKYNKKEKVIRIMLLKFQETGYGIEEFIEDLKRFYNK